MDLDAPGLENAHVRLEPFEADHACLLDKSGAVEAMWRWMPVIPGGVNFDAYIKSTLRSRDAGRTVPFTIFRQSDGAFAGVCEFGPIDDLHRRVRIASPWHPEEMRGGLVFPASQALLIRRAYEWGARRIAWTVDARNERARRAVEKLGAAHEGVLRSFMRLTDGHWADIDIFSMTRDEAAEAAIRLEDMLARLPD